MEAGELIIVSLTDYPAMYEILGREGTSLSGRTLANLSSDTPAATRDAAAWARTPGRAQLMYQWGGADGWSRIVDGIRAARRDAVA